MKKPTLEEVKEHFKNAKVVKNYDGVSVNMKQKVLDGLYFSEWGNYTYKDEECDYIYLWSKKKGYADIIEYKELEPVKPKHYEVSITNRKTKESINCDYIDIAKGLDLTNSQFLALRYFRKKGDLDKQINDTKKGIESYKAHLENLELLKLKNE